MQMPLPNHSAIEQSVKEMVLSRVPVLVDDAANEALLAGWTLEYMHVLEPCLQIATAKGTITEDLGRIGNEANYAVVERSMLSDLVAIMALVRIAANNSVTTGSTTSGSTFIKKAKAGEAEVEYGQLNVNTSATWHMTPKALMEKYQKDAINKAAMAGCEIEICSDCSVKLKSDCGCSQTIPFIIPSQGAVKCSGE